MANQTVGRWPTRQDREPWGYRSYTPGNAQYYSGEMLMFGKDDGLVKPASGTLQNGGVVGICDNYDVLVSVAVPLPTVQMRTQYGCFNFLGDGSITADTPPNTLLYAADTQTVTATQSGLLPVAGRLFKYISGDPSGYPVYVEIGNTPSGSTL